MEELLDRQAIKDLVEAFAYYADRRDAVNQAAVFIPDVHFVVLAQGEDGPAALELNSRDALLPIFEHLKKYKTVTHLCGQNMVKFESSSRATGVSYVMAHLLSEKDDKKTLDVQSIRYLDIFVKQSDGKWLIAERKLVIDWKESRII